VDEEQPEEAYGDKGNHDENSGDGAFVLEESVGVGVSGF
jgi:hypothetical protein